MWPAVATGPVKCGTMPTLWVSHTAMILSISVMPPTFGSDARAKSMSRCSTSGTELRPRPPLFAGRERHGRQQAQLRDLGAELLFANRVLDAERAGRLHEPADFHGLVEVELLVQIDHPVAVRSDALADLLHRLDDQPDA